MDTEQRFTARIPGDLFQQIRVLAALKGQSINTTICEILEEHIVMFEERHGKIPTLPKEPV